MPRPCSICIRDDVGKINAALKDWGYRVVAMDFKTSESAMYRHLKHIEAQGSDVSKQGIPKQQAKIDSKSEISIKVEREPMPRVIGDIEVAPIGKPMARKSMFTIDPEASGKEAGERGKWQKIKAPGFVSCPRCQKMKHKQDFLELADNTKICVGCYEKMKVEAYRSDGYIKGRTIDNEVYWFKTSAEIKPLMRFWEGKKLIEVTVAEKDLRPALAMDQVPQVPKNVKKEA